MIPHFVHEQYQQQRSRGRFPAVTMLTDVSGFTPLTEALMQQGKDGAEVLAEALAYIFRPLVATVYARGGFVATFAGDAFTAIFTGLAIKDVAADAVYAACFIQRFFAQHGLVQTRYGPFEMGVKVGLSCGEVEWGILGAGERSTYFFRGPALAGCARAESCAERGEVLLEVGLWPHLQGQFEALAAGEHYRLLAPPAGTEEPPRFTPAALDRAVEAPFVPEEVLDFAAGETRGEFRNVASVFISFQPPAHEGRLSTFVTKVLDLAARYGGYFKDLDFGDKGPVIVVVFGAPAAHENDLERAAGLLLALAQEESGVSWRAGLSWGIVYAGMMGGDERREYTVLGDAVNLAARLMQASPWGEIWVSAAAAARLPADYLVEDLGEHSFKGKQGTQPVRRLIGRRVSLEEVLFPGRMVGRAVELAALESFLEPIWAGRFAGVAWVYGEAGVGKSRLTYELRECVTAAGSKWFLCPADALLRQSLNPFRHFLQRYLDQSPIRLPEDNRARCEKVLAALRADLTGPGFAGDPDAARLAQEVERTASFLGALVDLHWEGSLYEQLDPQQRFENTLLALKALLLAESRRGPLVLRLEDIHWLDDDSWELLRFLTRNVERFPLAIVATGRYRDDGSRIDPGLDPEVPQQVWELRPLGPEGVQALVGQVLGGEIAAELVTLLAAKSEGNPFFVEQLLLELRERGALERDASGTWRPAGGAVEVPARIGTVLIARLDRLTARVKQVVQAAAVLGREFEVQVLSQMLREEPQLLLLVRQAEVGRIWSALSELRYLFRHALMRDAAYEMQLRARLRELHALAGVALEGVYAGDLAPHYADLSYHYGRAEDAEQERHYARLAGEQAAARFANAEAVTHLSRALELTPAADRAARYDLLLARERVYDLLGARQAQQADLAALQALVEDLDDGRRRIEVALRRSHSAVCVSDYPQAIATAQEATCLAQLLAGADDAGVAYKAQGHFHWGQALWPQGEYGAARTEYERALSLAQRAALPALQADCLRGLGTVSARQDDYAAARTFYEQALALYRELDNPRGAADTLNNLGLVFSYVGDNRTAGRYMEQALTIYRRVGDRLGTGRTLGNLGLIAQQHGDLAQARDAYDQGRHIYSELGDRTGVARSYYNLGSVLKDQGDMAGARSCREQALALYRQVGDRNGECVVLIGQGGLAVLTGDYALAHVCYERALAISRQIGSRRLESYVLLGLGDIRLGLGEYAAAVAHYEQARQISRQIDYRKNEGQACWSQGVVALRQGDYTGACDCLEEARHILHEVGDRLGESGVLSYIGLLYCLLDDGAAAQSHCQQALDVAREVGNQNGQGRALASLGRSLLLLGQPAAAAAAYRESLEIWRALGQPHLAAEARAGLALADLQQGNPTSALAHVEEILVYLEAGGTLPGTDEPFRVYLACYRILRAHRDPRAPGVLATAYHRLQALVAQFSEAEEQRVFLDVTTQREIIAVWEESKGKPTTA